MKSIFLNPRYRKVYQLPLFHVAHDGISDLHCFDRMGFLKSLANLDKILPVHIQRFIADLLPHTVNKHSTAFCNSMLARIFRPDISEMERGILIIIHADQQYFPTQSIKFSDRRTFPKNVAQVMVFHQILCIFPFAAKERTG